VLIPSSHIDISLNEDIGHEGSHVETDQALIESFKPNGTFNGSLNLTEYDTEYIAYHVNAAIIQASGEPRSLDPNNRYVINPGDSSDKVNQTINQYLADPASDYGVSPESPGPRIFEPKRPDQ